MISYPLLEVALDNVRHNARVVTDLCAAHGLRVAGVVKVSDGDVKIARAYYEGGCAQIASSRPTHLRAVKEELPQASTMLLRLPMLSEIAEVIRWCDMSLNSEQQTLKALDAEAKRQGKVHQVILMLDVGDLREGVTSARELLDFALMTENELDGLHLAGVGATFTCFGSILPTRENLTVLVKAAGEIERKIGRKLEIISGGSSTSLIPLLEGKLPAGVNHLRIGGVIANPRTIRLNRDVVVPNMKEDTFVLRAQLVEVAEKPSLPFGVSSLNWAGEKVTFVDRGMRKRGIAALGTADLGDLKKLTPVDPQVEVLGGSSDHLVLDLDACSQNYQVGDVVSFYLLYEHLMHAFGSHKVRVRYHEGSATWGLPGSAEEV